MRTTKQNSANLKQIAGGMVIKQNDFVSTFKYELLDEQYVRLDSLNGKQATIILVRYKEDDAVHIAYQTSVTVKNGAVAFQINRTLEPATYIVEIKCEGYIFSSDNRTKLTVNRTGFVEEQPAENNQDKLVFDMTELNHYLNTLKNIDLDALVNIPQSIKDYATDDLNFVNDLKRDIQEKIVNRISSIKRLTRTFSLDYTEAALVLDELNKLNETVSDVFLEDEEISTLGHAKSIIENGTFDTQDDLDTELKVIKDFIAKVKQLGKE